MTSMMKNILSYSLLGIGLLVYCCCLYVEYMFVESTIVMMLTILGWTLLNYGLDNFDRQKFSYIISISGFILATSVFLFYGVTEVPIPRGAMIINLTGVATSLFIICLSILPIIYATTCDNDISFHSEFQSNESQEPQLEVKEEESFQVDDGWEIATDDDINSGNFEVAA